ncbi:transposase [Phreatobacter stygius]|uniref:transposase n=1 Tax=Phreatobacter stygius TaxID=1940610 RepID=UPI003CCC522D
MGEDGAALPWQAERSGPQRQEQPAVRRGGSWIVRTGSPWRDLPVSFGNWSTVYTRFRDWVAADVFDRLFEAMSDEPDMEYAMVDATIVKVHRHGQGAKGGLRARPSAAPKAA